MKFERIISIIGITVLFALIALGRVSLRITSGKIYEELTSIASQSALNDVRYWNPRFSEFTGEYVPRGNGFEEMDKIFSGTFAISDFKLRYGLVPKSFCHVTGYKKYNN